VEPIFLGITQGLTEFLPISSSGHLYLLKNCLKLNYQVLPFFVFLHLATLLAVCLYLKREIILSLRNRRRLLYIGIVAITTFFIGWIIDTYLRSYFNSKFLVSGLFLINGVILLSLKSYTQKRSIDSLTLKDALVLGILQGLAVLPGISRSGITIFVLLKRGFKIKEAFSFSFLMAIPVVIGVFLIKIKELSNLRLPAVDLTSSFISAFVFGLLALVAVKNALINKRFANFGYYCIIVSLLVLLR